MNIDYISDLPWVWIWLGALAAFPIVFGGLLKYDKWQERRRVGRYVEPQIAQATGVVEFAKTDLQVVKLSGTGVPQASGTGAVILASVTLSGIGVMAPSGVGLSPPVVNLKR